MPNRPLKPCNYPGCGVLVIQGYCIRHEQTSHNWSKKSAKERGYGHTWTKTRRLVLLRDGGICQVCLAKGRITEAREVDHIRPRSEGGTDDEANLQAICSECHKVKTQEEAQRGRGGQKV